MFKLFTFRWLCKTLYISALTLLFLFIAAFLFGLMGFLLLRH